LHIVYVIGIVHHVTSTHIVDCVFTVVVVVAARNCSEGSGEMHDKAVN
jgi:hypothetical protein